MKKNNENPYKILGVASSSDDKTIKTAYRELVKKYHPDQYTGSPLADIANEKLKQINHAYDEILKERKITSVKTAADTKTETKEKKQNTGVSFKTVRQLISQNKLSQAEIILIRLEKNAEWHYLNGLILLKKGMYSSAEAEIKAALKLDPNNSEYVGVLNNFSKNTNHYNARVNKERSKNYSLNTKDCAFSICPIDFCCEF